MALEISANNPLGLTVAGPGYGDPTNSSAYAGQTGVITSGLGYSFATFGTQSAGIAAGINYIAGKIQSGAVSTVSQLVNLFSPNDEAAFEQTTGLTASSPVSVGQAGLYAAGIAAGEGTLSAFGGANAFTGNPASIGAANASVGGAQSQAGGQLLTGLEKWVGASTGNIVFVVLGIVMLAAALYMMAVAAKVAPPPAEVVKTAALAAAG